MTTRALHKLLASCPLLENLCLRGLGAVTNTTCIVIGDAHPRLVTLDLSRCQSLDAFGMTFICEAVERRRANAPLNYEASGGIGAASPLKELRVSGLKRVSEFTLGTIARAFPLLEVLDLSYATSLTDRGLERFVEWHADSGVEMELWSASSPSASLFGSPSSPGMQQVQDERLLSYVELTARQMGFDPMDRTMYKRRLTRLRHLNLSHCPSLTDVACSSLAHAVPRLELLELAGIGAALEDKGIVQLLKTTPYLRKLDLEDAARITDDILVALTPPTLPSLLPSPSNSSSPAVPIAIPGQRQRPPLSRSTTTYSPRPPQTGEHLEHLVVSYATLLTPEAMTTLIRGCPKLHTLEADNTRINDTAVRAFVDAQRARSKSQPSAKLSSAAAASVDSRGAALVAIDCASVGRPLVDELATEGITRTRAGWRGWEARSLGYADARDGDNVPGTWGPGLDECDDRRVTLKSFRSWQIVDKWMQERPKRLKSAAAAAAAEANSSGSPSREGGKRWFGRRSSANSGANTPGSPGEDEDRGCTIM